MSDAPTTMDLEKIDSADLPALKDQLTAQHQEAAVELAEAQARIAKAEDRKDAVKPEIFEKVMLDYLKKKEAAEQSVAEIEQRLTAVTQRLEAVEQAEADRRRREEEERAAREAEERRRQEEEEARRREEEERRRQEEERARQEAERRRREEEKRAREEAERVAAAQAQAAERREAVMRMKELVAERDKLEMKKTAPRNAIEEMEFRKEMGEFESDAEFQEQVADYKDLLADIEVELDVTVKEIEELQAHYGIDPVDPEAAAAPAPVVEETIVEPEPAPYVAPPAPTPPPPPAPEPPVEVAPPPTPEPPVEVPPASSDIPRIEELLAEPKPAPVVEEEVEELDAPAAATAPTPKWDEVETDFFTDVDQEEKFFVNPCLVMQNPGVKEQVFDLLHDQVLIGSAPVGEVDVRLNHPSVDRKHARIKLSRGGYMIKDLGSRGGTYINGKKVTKSRLNHMDKIKIGEILLQVRLL